MNLNNYFPLPLKQKLHYYYQKGNSELPTIIFLIGYNSDIEGAKTIFLKEFCHKYNLSFLTFEYLGHGKSSGNLLDFTLSDWLINTENIISGLLKNLPLILIGSSMGAWISYLYTLKHSKYIKGLISIAPAIDFTQDISNILNNQGSNPTYPKAIKKNNDTITLFWEDGSESSFSNMLVEEGNKNLLLLTKPTININLKVKILHGMLDTVVNYQNSLKLVQKITSSKVEVVLFKNGDHRLNEPNNFQVLGENILDLVLNS